MPCDGITVAYTRVTAELSLVLSDPYGLVSVVNLMKRQGIDVEVLSRTETSATFRVGEKGIVTLDKGIIASYGVPDTETAKLKDALESVAGVLTQIKIMDKVKNVAKVLDQRTTRNGYVVMTVNI